MLMHRGSSNRCVVLENALTRAGCITFGDAGTGEGAVCNVYCIVSIEEVANIA